MNKLSFTLLVALSTLGGVARADESAPELPSQPFNESYASSSTRGYVFGRDHRTLVTSTGNPWRMIGKIETPDGSCTGSLVARDLVLTNTHCVLDDNGNVYQDVRFYPNMRFGKSDLSTHAVWIWWGRRTSEQDWALIRLASPIGDRYGWFGIKDASLSALVSDGWQDRLTTAGYSGDYYLYTAGAHVGCSVTGWKTDSGFRHNCDTEAGASGSPIFGYFNDSREYDIVGLNWGHDDESNLGVLPEQFIPTWRKHRQDNEGKSVDRISLHLCNHSRYDSINGSVTYASGQLGYYAIAKDTCVEVMVPTIHDAYRVSVHAYVGNVNWNRAYHDIYNGKLNVYNFND